AAAGVLVSRAGGAGVVERVIEECRGANPTVVRAFSRVLAPLDAAAVDHALQAARRNPMTAAIATELAGHLAVLRRVPEGSEVTIAAVTPDVIGDVSDDPLGIQEDVQTLTAVIMARQVTPPLAVGLFGDWGTGKSWFMESVRVTAQALAEESARTGDRTFCTHVVPIEFNAWHYADSNLLASLVNHILKTLLKHVHPVRTPEEEHAELVARREIALVDTTGAEAELAAAQQQIDQLQGQLQTLQLARETSEIRVLDLKASDVRALLSQNPELETDVRKALEKAGYKDAVASLENLTAAAAEVNSAREWILSLWRDKSRTTIALLVIVLLVGIPLVSLGIRELTRSDFFAVVSAAIAEFTLVVSAAAAALHKAAETVNAKLAPLREARLKVEKVLEEKRKEPSEEEKELANRVADREKERVAAAARLQTAREEVAKLEQEIHRLQVRHSFAQFLLDAERVYHEHLGVISTIRGHFESLGGYLDAAAKAVEDPATPVDRVVLYIDDLDRCPADKVLEVLEAVHLLLAYPLFVVIVGVDPRWLLNSLSDRYTAFQNGGATQSGASARWNITPQNYLEKIFQIPFTLRPMSDTGYQNLVDRLFAPAQPDGDGDQPVPQQTRQPDGNGDPATTPTSLNGVTGTAASPPADTRLGAATPGPGQTPAPAGRPDQPNQPGQPETQTVKTEEGSGEGGGVRPRFVVQKEALVIQSWEADFAKRLYPLMPTPRAAKRFSNIYRMLKAPVSRDRLEVFEGTASQPGEFQVPMLLLALSIGMSAEAAALFPALRARGAQDEGLVTALTHLASEPDFAATVAQVQARIGAVLQDPRFMDSAAALTEWVPRVARFSFNLGGTGGIHPPAVVTTPPAE
ncbi:MAG TPA: P-loop NTPase fold protein, partial [Longimicrobium sp.]|nr:P-loop NTPase fold protein [Longimicrobium sp.]